VAGAWRSRLRLGGESKLGRKETNGRVGTHGDLASPRVEHDWVHRRDRRARRRSGSDPPLASCRAADARSSSRPLGRPDRPRARRALRRLPGDDRLRAHRVHLLPMVARRGLGASATLPLSPATSTRHPRRPACSFPCDATRRRRGVGRPLLVQLDSAVDPNAAIASASLRQRRCSSSLRPEAGARRRRVYAPDAAGRAECRFCCSSRCERLVLGCRRARFAGEASTPA
jgi:hypothetical protein